MRRCIRVSARALVEAVLDDTMGPIDDQTHSDRAREAEVAARAVKMAADAPEHPRSAEWARQAAGAGIRDLRYHGRDELDRHVLSMPRNQVRKFERAYALDGRVTGPSADRLINTIIDRSGRLRYYVSPVFVGNRALR